jgi:mRNA-degrading endonuclease toxin of MazEF toxin-antitoxin module
VPRTPKRGEIWRVNLGGEGKIRPCLLLTETPREDELRLFTIVAHTTSVRGNRWELEIKKPFLLTPGAFQFQEIHTVRIGRLLNRIGALSEGEMRQVERHLRYRLGF